MTSTERDRPAALAASEASQAAIKRVNAQAGHTPGPWIVNESQEDCLYGKVSIETEGEYFIAQVDESINQAANARLIAAAPELLEALQLLLEQDDNGEDEIWVRKKARDAIAKATGEQP